jgi:hypothetical protein
MGFAQCLGHQYAMSSASAGLTPASSLKEILSGMFVSLALQSLLMNEFQRGGGGVGLRDLLFRG